MKRLGFVLLLSLAACGETVDQRFKEMCAEQKADPEAAAATELACKNSDYLTKDQKKMLVEGWDQIKAMRRDVAETEARINQQH